MAVQVDEKWTGKWAAPRIEKEAAVESVELLTYNLLLIQRRNGAGPVTVATVAGPCLTKEKIESLLVANPSPMFIVNLTPESYVPEDAFQLSRLHQIPIGKLNDLVEALKLRDPSSFVNKNVRFLERGLADHSAVRRFDRLADRLYAIERHGKRSVRAAMIHDYELTADSVRTAKERYGRFDVAVKTNPYGRILPSAERAGATFGADIVDWAGFLRWLGKA